MSDVDIQGMLLLITYILKLKESKYLQLESLQGHSYTKI
jgi:hypothetical protein